MSTAWSFSFTYVTRHQQMRQMSAKFIFSYVNRCAVRSKFVKFFIMPQMTFDTVIYLNSRNSELWKYGWKCLFAWIVLCLSHWFNKMLCHAFFLISGIPIKQSKIYQNSGMENDTTMTLVPKWSYTHVENIINNTSIWSPHLLLLSHIIPFRVQYRRQ